MLLSWTSRRQSADTIIRERRVCTQHLLDVPHCAADSIFAAHRITQVSRLCSGLITLRPFDH